MSEENLTFEQLKDEFKTLFNREPDGEGENWIFFKTSAGNLYIHYELIQRGNDCYIELHVETGAQDRAQWIEAIKKAYEDSPDSPKYKRNILTWSYYSSYFWQCRRPVTTEDEIESDLELLKDLLKTANNFKNNQQSNTNDNSIQECNTLDSKANECKCIANGMCHLKCIAEKLGTNKLNIPSVQRGFVWNAARIAALWDSILRGFPIGAFSTRKTKECIDLLDGQQRASSIAMGFYDFPPKPNQLDKRDAEALGKKDDPNFEKELAYNRPILWIDLKGDTSGTEKEFLFYVTTMAHPWGYDSSDDETRNSTLSTFEKRQAIEGLKFSSNPQEKNSQYDIKPLPCELFPFKAIAPAPFALVKEYKEYVDKKEIPQNPTIGNFCNWVIEDKGIGSLENAASEWNWLKNLFNKSMDPANKLMDSVSIKPITDAIKKHILHDKTLIYCTDATALDEKDIALYFTRIGKGGVRPSDEELAFSVLKSKLGDDFKTTIDGIARDGFASPARLAHLAVRCFASSETQLWSGNVLAKAIDISMDEEKKGNFTKFIKEKLSPLINKAKEILGLSEDNSKGNKGFKPWHLARYSTISNGDILLFLLLECRDYKECPDNKKLDVNILLATIAVVDLYGYMIDRCFRYIREIDETIDYSTRVKLGLAKALRDSYRNHPMLQIPPAPKKFEEIANINDFLNKSTLEAELLVSGYDDPRMYSILLYACKGLPKYTPYSAKWAEENCPWDYDHILPKSWVEKLGKDDVCKKLINSIGNLAPLPFSLNRSLSDDERSKNYPLSENANDNDIIKAIQDNLLIQDFNGYNKLKGKEDFCETTIKRFHRLYKAWYGDDGLKIGELLNYDGLKKACENPPNIINRKTLLEKLKEELENKGYEDYEITAVMPDNTEGKISSPIEFYQYEWLSLQKDCDKYSYSIAFTLNSSMETLEIGLRKKSSEKTTTKEGRKFFEDNNQKIKNLDPKYEYQQKNSFWYFWKSLEKEENVESIVEKIKDLEDALASDAAGE